MLAGLHKLLKNPAFHLAIKRVIAGSGDDIARVGAKYGPGVIRKLGPKIASGVKRVLPSGGQKTFAGTKVAEAAKGVFQKYPRLNKAKVATEVGAGFGLPIGFGIWEAKNISKSHKERDEAIQKFKSKIPSRSQIQASQEPQLPFRQVKKPKLKTGIQPGSPAHQWITTPTGKRIPVRRKG